MIYNTNYLCLVYTRSKSVNIFLHESFVERNISVLILSPTKIKSREISAKGLMQRTTSVSTQHLASKVFLVPADLNLMTLRGCN